MYFKCFHKHETFNIPVFYAGVKALWYFFYNNLPVKYFLFLKRNIGLRDLFIYPQDKQQFTKMEYKSLLCNSLLSSKDIADDRTSKSDECFKENETCSLFEAWRCFKNPECDERFGFYTKAVASGRDRISVIRTKNHDAVNTAFRFGFLHADKAKKMEWSQLTICSNIVDISTVTTPFANNQLDRIDSRNRRSGGLLSGLTIFVDSNIRNSGIDDVYKKHLFEHCCIKDRFLVVDILLCIFTISVRGNSCASCEQGYGRRTLCS